MVISKSDFKILPELPSTWEEHAHIYQGYEWQKLFNAYGRKNWALGITEGEKLLGFVLIGIPKPYSLDRPASIRRWVNYLLFPELQVLNGPVAFESGFELKVHERFCEILKTPLFTKVYRQRIFVDKTIPPAFMEKLATIYETNGFRVQESHTFLLRTSLPLEDLWSRVHPKKRNRVNWAKRNGIIAEEVQDIKGLNRYWEIRKENWLRNGTPIIPFSHFVDTWNALQPSGAMKVFVSVHDGNDLAGQILFLSKNHIQLNGVAVSNHNMTERLAGNELLQWHIIEWAHEDGFMDIDYVGATPNSKDPKEQGIHRFKASWGGDLVKYYIFVRDIPGWRSRIARLKGFGKA